MFVTVSSFITAVKEHIRHVSVAICPLISANEMVNNCHPLVLNEIDVADHDVPFGLIVA